MGKNKILDLADKEKVRIEKLKVKNDCINMMSFPQSRYFGSVGNHSEIEERFRTSRNDKCLRMTTCLLSIVYCLLFLTSCSLPRIIILDDPLSPEEHINLGVAYEKKREIDNALKEYKLASKKLPLAYLYLGNIYFQKNDFDEAESAYKKAIKKDPNNSDAYNNLAWLYYTKKENLDEAETLALKAMELNPSKKELYRDTLEKIRGAKGK